MVAFLLIMGVILGSAAVNGTIPDLGAQANKDLFNQGGKAGFLEWVLAIIVIAIIAKSLDIPDARKTLLVLVFVVFFLAGGNGDLLTSIVNQISSLGSSGATPPSPPNPGLTPIGPAASLPTFAQTPAAPGTGPRAGLTPIGPAPTATNLPTFARGNLYTPPTK